MIDFTHRQISTSDIDRAADCIGNNEKTRECELRQTIYGTFPYDYKIENLKDLCVTQGGIQTGPFGSQLHQEDYVDVGTPILTVEHLGENRITHNNIPRISNADRCRLAKYSLESGDIVFSRVGSVDRRALVRPAEEGWLFSGRCLRVRPDQKKLDSGYLSYFFGLDSFKKYIRSVAVGATMPSLNTAILSDIEIPHPKSLPEQRRIAHVLGTLDDKIENNRKTAKTLEAMAQAIFKSWFVDFDPVRAKMAGEPRESICKRLKLTPEILDLFPDRLVDSELGEIPEGWRVAPLSDMYSFQNGYAFKSKDWQDYGVPVIKIGSVKPGLVDLSNVSYVSEEVANQAKEYQLLPADLVIGMTGYVGEVGLVPKASVCPMLNQRVGRIILDGRGTQHVSFAYCLTRQSAFKNAAEIKAHGTAQANVSSSAIMSINTMAPTDTLRSAFDRLCAIIFDELLTAHETAMILSKLRDTLLPKLISGEIRVPETDKSTQDFRGHHV